MLLCSFFFFFKQKTAYEMRISDWSSDVCSSDLRKTWQDHYPHAAMHLFDAHMAQLKASTEANRCGATDTLPHLQALRMVANDLEPAFGDLGEDTRFAKHASDLRAVLDSTLAAPPLNCTGVGAAMGKIGEA